MTTDSPSSIQKQLEPETKTREKKQGRASLIRRLIWVVAAAILLLVGYKVTRIGVYSWQAYRSGSALLELADQNLTEEDLASARASLDKLAAATSGLNHEMQPLAPIMHRLAPLPVAGGTLSAAPELLAAGDAFVNLGSDAFTVLGPELIMDADQSMLDTLMSAVTAAGPELAVLDGQATAAVLALNTIPADQLPPRLAGKIIKAQSLAGALPNGLKMVGVAPALAGAEEAKTYLLLIQNNHELRASGGFITAVGTLKLDNGKVENLNFADSYEIFRQDGEYGQAPHPMQEYMNIGLLLFRDANWSPDFPRSAQLASTIYTQDTGQVIDGVISIDLRAAELFFEGLGPLTVPAADEPVTAENIMEQLKRFFEKPLDSDEGLEAEISGEWWSQRKEFIPTLADAAMEKIAGGGVDYAALMTKGLQALDEGAVQVWLKDEDAAKRMAEAGWDGSVRPQDDADFLLYVDTNMGYNKVDSVMERSLAYEVSWPDGDDAPGLATTTMTYRHPIEMDGYECDQTPRYGDSYDDMARRCYFDYVRLYAPGGSDLINVEGVEPDSIDSKRGESGTNVFSGFFIIKPGSEHTVTFTYRLPTAMTQEDYRLVVQKQSGAAPLPLTVKVADDGFETTLQQRRLEWSPSRP